tara:strand:+ start:3486 stop:3794 length:309 start_codon:yes stop_codon:yes gene_type:complete
MDTTIISFAIVGNICNLAYNIPFVYVVLKHWNADNISQKFLSLRVFSSMIWITYGILTIDVYIAVAYVITLISSMLVLYVKMTQVKNVEQDKQIMHIKETYI